MAKKKKTSLQNFSEPTNPTATAATATATNNSEELKEKLSDLKSDFDSGADPEPKKESAYKKRKRAEQEQDEQFAGSISNVGSMALSLIIDRLPKNIPLTPEERTQFDAATSALLMKYVSYLGNYKEETAFATILMLILVPRLDLFKKKELKEKSENGTEKTA